LNDPARVFLIKDPVPITIPFPPSKGPFTKPSIGLSIKSKIPTPKC
jgi:hypothetical protein